MSEIKSTRELPEDFHDFFNIICDGFPSFAKRPKGRRKVEVRVNANNPDIVTLELGGFRISTVRSAWAVVVGALVDIIGAENIEINLPAKTFRIEFNDVKRTATAVEAREVAGPRPHAIRCDGCDQWKPEETLKTLQNWLLCGGCIDTWSAVK